MGEFFSSWATWEKLVFILGCAIVVTVVLGCAKLGYTHWKLRKYSAAEEEEKSQQAMQVQRQMSRRRPPEGRSDDVPFGIRAIESGIEVEGVWVSRGNTPEPPSSRDTTKSTLWDHVPRRDFNLDIEQQRGIQNYDRANTSSLQDRTSTSFAGAVSAEPLSSTQTSRDPSLDRKPPQSKQYPPSSYTKYNGNPALQQSTTMSPMEGIDAIYRVSGSYHRNGTNGQSFGSSNSTGPSSGESTDSELIAASAPGLLNNQARQRQQSTDLDLMHSHRMSQAAETGQLTPRVRRPGFSGEWASIANGETMSTASETGEYFGAMQRTRSSSPTKDPSPTALSSPGNAFILPKIDTLPAAVRRSSLPDVTPFMKFCQTAPPSPLPDGYRPASACSNKSTKSAMQQVGDSLSVYMSAPSSPIATTPANAPSLPGSHQQSQKTEGTRPRTAPETTTRDSSQDSQRPSFEKRQSRVIRGHGTGFEILRPGTFAPPTAPVEQTPEKLQKLQPPLLPVSAPPISLHNGMRAVSMANSSRPRSGSAGSGRKLQKKRRPSSDSETGAETQAEHGGGTGVVGRSRGSDVLHLGN